MSTPLMRPVTSSNIEAIGYDQDRHALFVTFKGSGTYIYDDVPPEIDAELIEIEAEGGSIGRFFQASIKNYFPSTKLSAEELAGAV